MSEKFDVVVLGAGQAGKPLASDFARAGRKTVLVEREAIGGTCINVGCTPTKTMVASARVAHLARRGGDYGVISGGVRVDQAKVRERKRAIVESFRSSGQRRLEELANLTLIFGEGRFTAPHTLEVKSRDGSVRELAAEIVVVNTGCRPARPALDGLDAVPWLDSTTVMELEETPAHLVVLGGGYIGLEFGQMFRRFGSRVTIVHRGARLLDREDDDVSQEIAKILEEDGIEIVLNARAQRVERAPDGGVALTLDGKSISGSHLLLATGRVPNTEKLDLKNAGINANSRGYIAVDEHLRTSAEGVYAAGDVVGGPAFTHISYDDYRILRNQLLRGEPASTRGRPVPFTVFTDPELAHIGLRERETAGLDVRVMKMPMSWVARALEMDETRGFMKAIVDAATQKILGFTVLGVGGGELMAVVEMAMAGGLTAAVLRDTIFVHPTMAESLNNLFAQLD